MLFVFYMDAWSSLVKESYIIRKIIAKKLLETYLKKNKHLPDVPSSSEVIKKGINVGEMDATLLKKIEEQTLYIINLQKQINELSTKVETLEKK